MKIKNDAHVVDGVKVGLGVMVRNSERELVTTTTKVQHAYKPRMAETLIVRYGFSIAQRFGYKKILVESDSINGVNAVKEGKMGNTPFQLVLDDITVGRSYFNCFNICHIKRACNTVAYLVAKTLK